MMLSRKGIPEEVRAEPLAHEVFIEIAQAMKTSLLEVGTEEVIHDQVLKGLKGEALRVLQHDMLAVRVRDEKHTIASHNHAKNIFVALCALGQEVQRPCT